MPAGGKVIGVPRVLYHATPATNLDAILSEGLLPRTRSLREAHPPRVYLTPSPARALTLCWQLRWAMVEKGIVKRNWREDFAILAVRADMGPCDLFEDPSSRKEGGLYAEEGFPPEAIRHVETVDGVALLSGNTSKTWNWAVWGRPRPDFLVSLGTTTGVPGWEGWKAEGCREEKSLDLDALWADAPAPRM